MTLESNVRALFIALEDNLRKDLSGFAADTEEKAVMESEGHWESDSGSARESITAYSIGEDSYDKNFSNWENARVSGYHSPIWGNPSENFYPHVEEVDVGGDIGVILTMFVEYAETLELGITGEGKPGHGNREAHHSPIVPGTLAATFAQQQEEFLMAVQESIDKTLA